MAISTPTTLTDWRIDERELPVHDADALSSIFCVGNGATTTRGTGSEEGLGSYRGTYLSGLFTRAGFGLVYFMVAPDWLPAFIEVDGARVPCVESRRVLDMQAGVLRCEAVFATGAVRVTLREERFASIAFDMLHVQRVDVTVEGGAATLVLGVDGDVRNHQAKYYKPGQLPNCTPDGLRLSQIEELRADAESLAVLVRSRQTGDGAMAVARVSQIDGPATTATYSTDDGLAAARHALEPGTYSFAKLCMIAGDIQGAQFAEDAVLGAEDRVALTYAEARAEHIEAMARFWETADVRIDGDAEAQRAVRFGVWSTRIAAPEDDGTSSVGAKNLSGDWYRGAVFWDMEIFQLPLLAAVAPERARNHILYRANRLNAARTLAAQDGYAGARFPWQSYASGLEDPPVIGGFLYMQQHLNAAIAWGILHYYALTGDADTLRDGGLEVLLELGNFWASRVVLGDDGLYHIPVVCGPDELHQGIDDNAYTNRMVAFTLAETVRLLDVLDDEMVAGLCEDCGVDEDVLAQWREIAARMAVPHLTDGVTMAQFAGFEGYPEPDEQIASQGHGRDKTNKQADTLLLFQNIPEAMGVNELAACWREYAPLCNQTSSLSLCTHALLAVRQGLLRDARRLFEAAAGVDLADTMGNTCEGIHGAGEGGIWQAIVNGYGGFRVAMDGVHIDPMLPSTWQGLSYGFLYRRQCLAVAIEATQVTVTNGGAEALALHLCGAPVMLAPGATHTAAYTPAWREAELEGVVFDLDGVLVRTDHLHFQAWKLLADELGIPFDEQKNHQLRGVSREESLRRIYGDLPLPDAAAFAAQCTSKNTWYVELVGQMSPADILPGALDLLRALRAAGIRTAIASASKNAGIVLERTGLGAYIDAVIDGGMVTASKPDPQGFYLAAQHLRCLPWNCLGVEDAAAGVEAIHRAGMVAVGVGDQVDAAEVVVPGTADLTVDRLRAIFREHECHTNPYLERNVAKLEAEKTASYK